MSTPRNQRRAQAAKAARIYGLKGDAALEVHRAYQALSRGDHTLAAQLAAALSAAHPRSLHPWLILGSVAVARREGATAASFLKQALDIAPRNAPAQAQMGMALMLQADPMAALDHFEAAMAQGHHDAGVVQLYAGILERAGQLGRAGATLAQLARATGDGALALQAADLLMRDDQPGPARDSYARAAQALGDDAEGRLARMKAAFLGQDYATTRDLAQALLEQAPAGPAADDIALHLMGALRVLGARTQALDLLDSHAFRDPVIYQLALAVAANVQMDLGRPDLARDGFEDALHVIADGRAEVARAYGATLLRDRDMARGAPLFSERHGPARRAHVPVETAASDRLQGLDRLWLVQEQGIGDQLALLPLAVRAAQAHGLTELSLVAAPRLLDLLQGRCAFALDPEPLEDVAFDTLPGRALYLGDLAAHLDLARAQGGFSGYLIPDPARVDALRKRYATRAAGRPVIGLSWASSASGSGLLRSLPLDAVLARLPGPALVIDLQYGDTAAQRAAASRQFPDLEIFRDPEIDQIADIAGFAAQIAALDRVVTIDNTTAHVCGALGHGDSHLLLPAGAERMWYWGPEGGPQAKPDAWYGCLTVHAQTRAGDWTPALAALADTLAG